MGKGIFLKLLGSMPPCGRYRPDGKLPGRRTRNHPRIRQKKHKENPLEKLNIEAQAKRCYVFGCLPASLYFIMMGNDLSSPVYRANAEGITLPL